MRNVANAFFRLLFSALNILLLSIYLNFSPNTSAQTISISETPTNLPKHISLLGTYHEREMYEPIKEKFRKISMALVRYRHDHNGQLPEWLSDLFPNYLEDEKVLLDEDVPTGTTYPILTDTKIPTNFLYEFANAPHGNQTYREWKMDQMNEYGDMVPVVRYHTRPKALNLSYGGMIYLSSIMWENTAPTGHSPEDHAAKVRQQLLTIASAILKYREENKNDPPNLAALVPNYIDNPADLTNKITKQPFTYTFENNNPEQRKLYYALRNTYGAYVPIVQAKNVLPNSNVINVGYTGEIWESTNDWESDLLVHQTIPITSNPFRETQIEVPHHFYGIGAKLRWIDDQQSGLKVIEVYEGTPADNEGLQKDNFIIGFNDNIIGAQNSSLRNKTDVFRFIQSSGNQKTLVNYIPKGVTQPQSISIKPVLMKIVDGKTVPVHQDPPPSNVPGKKEGPLTSLEKIRFPHQMTVYNGQWDIKGATVKQKDVYAQHTLLMFDPMVDKGELEFQARAVSGYEGFRVIFGYQSPDSYFVWNLGGWTNTMMGIEHWHGLDSASPKNLLRNFDKPFKVQYEKWYKIRVHINNQTGRMRGFIDDKNVWEFHAGSLGPLKGRFGIGTWRTISEFKNINIKGSQP